MSKKARKPETVMASHVRRQPRFDVPKTPEQELIARHQAALRAIDRMDMTRDLRLQTGVDYNANIIKTIAEKSGPIPSYGPRTGTHPMATRIRPPLINSDLGPADHVLQTAVQCLAFAAAAMAVTAFVLELGS